MRLTIGEMAAEKAGTTKKLKRSSSGHAGKAILRISLHFQDNCPHPNILEDPRKNRSSPPACSSQAERATAPKPMRFAPWAYHLRRLPHLHE